MPAETITTGSPATGTPSNAGASAAATGAAATPAAGAQPQGGTAGAGAGQAAGAGAQGTATNQAAGTQGKPAEGSIITGAGQGEKPGAAAANAGDQAGKQQATGAQPYELKLPDGAKLTAETAKAIAAEAHKRGLPQEQAQWILEQQNAAVAAHEQTIAKQWDDHKAQWVDQIKADKEIGGEKFQASVENARRAFAAVATPEDKQFLEETGLGNHPFFVRILSRFGSRMREDTFHGTRGGQGAPTDKDVLAERYPTMAETT